MAAVKGVAVIALMPGIDIRSWQASLRPCKVQQLAPRFGGMAVAGDPGFREWQQDMFGDSVPGQKPSGFRVEMTSL